MWAPLAGVIHVLIPNANTATILALIGLYGQFLWLVSRWSLAVHRQHHVFRRLGLEWSRRNGLHVLRGFGIGLSSVLLIVSLQTLLGWVSWRSPTWSLLLIILEGLVVALAIGFAEELFFRGWLLDELQRDYAPPVAMWASAAVFAAVHLRIWTFPALLLLGVALVWAKRSHPQIHLGKRYTLLGLPIGLHAGLVYGNYVLEVGKLIQVGDRVPTWVTGIDNNPLAGVVGILFMAVLAGAMAHYAKRQTRSSTLLKF